MGMAKAKLTVLFEDPFWVGLYEREDGGRYEVCKTTFGAEPRDFEIYELLLKKYNRLRFSPSIEGQAMEEKRINPKRMQRAIMKTLTDTGIGTKAQQALKLQQEQGKTARKVRTKEMREQEEKRKFEMLQVKKREKHKGH